MAHGTKKCSNGPFFLLGRDADVFRRVWLVADPNNSKIENDKSKHTSSTVEATFFGR